MTSQFVTLIYYLRFLEQGLNLPFAQITQEIDFTEQEVIATQINFPLANFLFKTMAN
jgi:hypothetical protein